MFTFEVSRVGVLDYSNSQTGLKKGCGPVTVLSINILTTKTKISTTKITYKNVTKFVDRKVNKYK